MTATLSSRRGLLALLIAIGVLCAAAPASAQTVGVQGALRTTTGGPVADGKYTLTVALYGQPGDAKPAWSEIHVALPVSGGGFSFALGGADPDKSPLPKALFEAAVMAGKGPWLGVKVEDEAELPRVALGPVPYALFAQKAKVADALAAPIGADQLADGAVTSAKVGFAYAGSASKGGPAAEALVAQEANKAKTAQLAETALKAEDAKSADVAFKLACTGCVLAEMVEKGAPQKWVAAGALHKVAVSGKYADLDGGPDLAPYARLDKAQLFADVQTLGKGGVLGGALDFAKNEAVLFRVQNADAAPAPCDAMMEGGIYFDKKQKRFMGCNGKTWTTFTAGLNSQDSPGVSCLALLQSGEGKASGYYWLQPPKATKPRQVWCEQEKGGGGWALVLHIHQHAGMSENKFLAAFGHNRFTDVDWNLVGGSLVTAGNGAVAPQPNKVTGALDIAFFDGGWSDLRAACNKANGNLTEEAYGVVPGYAKANGNFKLLGGAANGTSYPVDKATNSSGNTTIWVDNELNTENGGHYLCDTTNGGDNGTTQLSLCYTDFLNNNNTLDHGDSIVALGFGTTKGDDSWSAGFSGECGSMGTGYLGDVGTFSYWVR
ncbi:MAG: hypothetical protein EXR79_01690 [Myxococcales bacterium]|nr:hypothetical protein [Myxococcales bacterium]